jgi:hypothetical protein
VTNAFKLYLHNNKYRIIDEQEFIDIAKDKILYNDTLKKKYLNKEINKLNALKVFQQLGIKTLPVNALLVEIKEKKNSSRKTINALQVVINQTGEPILKTIEKIEEDIEKFIFTQLKENTNNFTYYLKGSKDAIVTILEEELHYNVIDKDRTLEDFIDKEIYFTTDITYKDNHIKVELTKDKFICDLNTKKIYKYKSTILDMDGYQFSFRKNELFPSREIAIEEAKKLVDEHYNLPIRNGKIQKIIVRTDDQNTVIVFWPDIITDNDYIMANDLIGMSDLAGDTKTSLLFFNECKDALPMQIKIAKNVIEKCMNIQTMSIKHL